MESESEQTVRLHVEGNATEYPYDTVQKVSIPFFNDLYKRSAASLLQSIRTFTRRIIRSTTTEYPITIAGHVIGPDDVHRALRVCSNTMTGLDYLFYLNKYTTEFTRKGSTVLHVEDMDTKVEQSIFDELPSLALYQEVILSTTTSTGKIVLFLILPTNKTLNVFTTTPCEEDDGVHEITTKLLAVIRRCLLHDYSVVHRLSLQRPFHADPFFFALFLIFLLQRHGRYLLITEKTILQYKLSFVESCIAHHDEYLGRLHIRNVSSLSYPFYTTGLNVDDNLEFLEQKGWHVMDVKGDGHCGYYALLLALCNVGIDDFDIDTTEDSPRQRKERWQRQVVDLRKCLRNAAIELLEEVYRPDTTSRTLPWWCDILGVYTESDWEQLSEGFVNPDFEGKPSRYFTPDFADKEENIDYHMAPYWSALVIAYAFKVRVVVVTRTTSPDPENPKGVKYFHSANVFNFEDHFQESIDTYTPVVQFGQEAIRISDTQFYTKKTIELLYTTGFKKDGTIENNHFQFLRRIYCNKVTTNTAMSTTRLGECLQTQLSHTSASQTSTAVENVTMIQPTTAPPDHPTTRPTTIEATALPMETRADLTIADAPIPMDTDPLQPVVPRPTGKRILPPKVGKKNTHTAPTKKAEKQVIKAKQPSKVSRTPPTRSRLVGPARIGGTAVNTTHSDEENESQVANDGDYDYMYDRVTGYFYRGTLNNKLRRYLNKTRVPDITLVDKEILEAAKNEPNTWISPGLGNPWDDPPPKALTTKEPTLYQQVNNPFCLTYCLASALYYCGFQDEASLLAGQAEDLVELNMRSQLKRVVQFMPNLVPLIGGATIFNQRSKSNKRKKRLMTWDMLLNTCTRYPTLVVLAKGSGRMNHAICVVDDLIFDASTSFAMKLTMESMQWIFQDDNLDIFIAYRFENKVSPPGHRIPGEYDREPRFVWNREARERAIVEKYLTKAKAYEVELVDPEDDDDTPVGAVTIGEVQYRFYDPLRSRPRSDPSVCSDLSSNRWIGWGTPN